MPKGRPAKPTALKVLQRNPGKRALPKNEPAAPIANRCPGVPRHLKGEARKCWRKVGPVLHSMRVLTDADLHALELYCMVYARYRKAEDELAKGDYIKETDKGYLYPNPWLGIANGAADQMRRIMSEFGMTPSSRVKVKTEPATVKDPLEDYLARKGRRD